MGATLEYWNSPVTKSVAPEGAKSPPSCLQIHDIRGGNSLSVAREGERLVV